MKKANRFAYIFSYGVTVLTLIYIGYRLDWKNAYDLLIRSEVYWLFLGVCLYLFNYLLRGLRFEKIYDDEHIVNRKGLYGITFCYGMLNYILPAKTGELAYIVMAKAHLSYNIIQNIYVILIARFFDFFAIALFLPIIFIQDSQLPGWVLSAIIIFEVLVLSGAFIFFFLRKLVIHFTYKFHNKSINDFLNNLIKHTNLMSSVKKVLSQILLAMLIWLCVYGNFYCIINAIGFRPGLDQVILISIVLVPLTLLPQGIANIGTHEVAWVSVFQLYGMAHQQALQIAVASHILLLVYVLLIGIIGLLLVLTAKNQNDLYH